jgi:3D (Asp-Asp-Asp) domain-containing protein
VRRVGDAGIGVEGRFPTILGVDRVPHPAGLFSGRMMARLALADWAASVAAPRPTRPRALAAALVASHLLLIAALIWALLPRTQPLPAFPPPLLPAPVELPPPPVEASIAPEVHASVSETPAAPAPTAAEPSVEPSTIAPTLAESPTPTATVTVMTTGYCPCERCCGGTADGITAINRDVRRHPHGIAVDPLLIPYRTVLSVPGYGTALVDDTGAAMRADGARGIVHLDLRFRTHAEARTWGVRWLRVVLPGDSPAALLGTAAGEVAAVTVE